MLCLDEWTEYGGNCYKYVDQKKDWEEARQSCVTEYQGGSGLSYNMINHSAFSPVGRADFNSR